MELTSSMEKEKIASEALSDAYILDPDQGATDAYVEGQRITDQYISMKRRRVSRSSKPSGREEEKIEFTVRSKAGSLPADGFEWRKYGEKAVRFARYTRSYFKCSNRACKVLKRSQRISEDTILLTYLGNHTCGQPAIHVSLTDKTTSADSFKQGSTTPTFPIANVDLLECSSHEDGGESGEASVIISGSYLGEAQGIVPPLREVCLTLSLDGICDNMCIYVGVRVQLFPPENMQFFFFNPEDMATCIGVGMRNAIVVLDKNFQIAIHEWDETDWEAENSFWIDNLGLRACHSVMNFQQPKSPRRMSQLDAIELSFMQLGPLESGQTQQPKSQQEMSLLGPMELSSLHGVGFDSVSHYTDETLDYSEDTWAVLYDIAFFVVTKSEAFRQRNNGSTTSSRPSPFKIHPKSNRRNQHACDKHKRTQGHAQGGEGDGGEDGEGNRYGAALEADNDDDIPMALRVVVHPYPKDSVFDKLLGVEVKLPRDGLEGASIASELVFDFVHNRERRRISITASSRLHLNTDNNLLYNNFECFGWYQNEIEMNLSCEDRLGRTAVLERNSCKMLNPITSSNYTVANTGALSIGQSRSTAGNLNIGLGGVVELQAALTGSISNKATTSSGQTIEMTRDSICGGFYPIDCSRSESPACARFKLIYPLDCFRVWDHKGFLISQGLFKTIEPELTGTWIPLNKAVDSPYKFNIDRKLNFYKKNVESSGNDIVKTYEQRYLLSFYINHAMTHLRREKGQHVELQGDSHDVPRVLKIARVC